MGANIKGSAITARVRYVREHYGEPGVRRLKDALGADARRRLDEKVMPHDWVPLGTFFEVCTEIDRLYGQGDLALCRELGRYAAKVNLPTLYRIFYALGSPRFILARAPRVWDVHYDSGRIAASFEARSPLESAALVVRDFAVPHRAHCLSVLGWAERSVELSGGTITEASEVTCRLRGDDACRFSITYRA